MIKSALAAVAALPFVSTAAFAGPYVNIESNAGWAGDDYTGAVTDFHVGFEKQISEAASWYIQGGPALVSGDDIEAETRYSGKVGLGVNVTKRLNVYGEISAITASDAFEMDDLGVGSKLGAKFSF